MGSLLQRRAQPSSAIVSGCKPILSIRVFLTWPYCSRCTIYACEQRAVMLLSVFGQSEHKCARSLRQWWARLARSPVPRSVGDAAHSGSWWAVRRSIQIQDGVRTSGGPGAARRLTCASGFPSEAADIRAMGRSKAKAHGLNSGTHFDPIFGTQNGYQNRAQWANFWYPK